MTDSIVCGIDIGSTNLKVLLMDGDARTLWVRSIAVPRVMQEGAAVTDAALLVATLEQMIIEGWQAIGASQPLRAIAITGVGEDGVPVSADLRPLDFAIPWFDRRARREAAALFEQLGDEVRGGVPIECSRTAAKWRWLRDHRPQVLDGASHWIALTDYPAAWWSRTPFISETLAARTGCYDVFDRRWMPRFLEACGAPPLPPVRAAGSVVGGVVAGRLIESGAASSSTLVVAGGHDHPVAASAVRRIDCAALVDSLGTANLMYDEVPAMPPRADPFIAFSVPSLGGPGVACLGVFEFAASLDPFRQQDDGVMLKRFLAAGSAPGEPGTARDIAQALQQQPGLELRVVLEASCFYARRMLESIRSAGSTSTRLYEVGGWARSAALVELRASVLGEPVVTIDEEELTALGAALVANDSIRSDGSSPLQRPTRVVQPNPLWQFAYERAWPQIRESLHALK